jgi:gluconokinase
MTGHPSPVHVVIMGVSGSGKTSVAVGLAERLDAEVIEGDDHHAPASIAKMAAGIPLDDDDRWPWLRSIAAAIAAADARGSATVTSCSALRRTYRDALRDLAGPAELVFLELAVDPTVLEARMRNREHFMPVGLLRSQVATLEPLDADEPGARLDATRPLRDVLDAAEIAARVAFASG